MMQNPPLLHNMHSFQKLLLLLILVIASMIFTLVFGVLIAIPIWGGDVLNKISAIDNSTDPSIITIVKYFQIVSQIGTFIIPVFIFALFDGKKVGSYLKLNVSPGFIIFILAGMSILFAAPLINYLSEWNMQMKMPSSLTGVEHWMRSSEDKAAQLTVIFLDVKTIWGFLVNILMIGILPAIGEEFLFRGIVQPLFHKWTKNIHVAVIIASFLFSAIHMQFYGFIPRFLMGVLLGYSFVWSGSLWVPVFLHFVNNTAAVIMTYLFKLGKTDNSFETIGTGDNASMQILVSIVLTSTTIFLMYYLSRRKKRNCC